MSEAKFTQGEWVRRYHANGCNYVQSKDVHFNGCYSIASCSGPDEMANAHLIAAAPKMYALLVQIQIEGGRSVARHRQIDRILAEARGEK